MIQADRLRNLRVSKDLTHQRLAELLHINIRQIARYESGEVDPSGEVLARIADVFGVTTDYLLGRSHDPTRYVQSDKLTSQEEKVLAALRRGEPLEAIRAIVCET